MNLYEYQGLYKKAYCYSDPACTAVSALVRKYGGQGSQPAGWQESVY